MLVPILMGIVGISIQSIGYVLQKIGIIHYKSLKQFVRDDKFNIWLLGTAIAFLGASLFFLALPLSSISIIQPIIGIGPAVVAIFGFFILKSNLHKYELIGIFLTVLGIFFLSYELNPNVSYLNINEFDFFLISVIIISIIISISNILYRFNFFDLGIEEGIISGVFGGFSSIFGKIGVFYLLESFTIHWALIALLFTQLISFILFQKGLHSGKMEKVVSVFTAMAILLPIAIGILFFGEILNVINILGIFIILIGSVMLAKQYTSLIA